MNQFLNSIGKLIWIALLLWNNSKKERDTMTPDMIVMIGKGIAELIAGFVFGYYRKTPYKAVLYSGALFVFITVLSVEIADRQARHNTEQQQVKVLE